ncbi:MAG: MMPL family transporter [Bacteroidales bacterium]|nr:MMPL family transporter [Bacteroidales bacterium]
MNSRKSRNILFALMTVLTACCLLLFPKININEDMTRYLPDNSRMKEGVDTLNAYFPGIDMNSLFVKAMFSGVSDKDSLAGELTDIDGVSGITSVEEKDGLVLYQLGVEDGAEAKSVASFISTKYGGSVIVEHNANSIMPDNMGMILMVGLGIVFIILFLMCSSIVEALLFILTIGMAVILNMGTNAFLPSVSMLTNTIVAVLQFILSMDYSIILMNRFRQVQVDEPDIDKAMGLALKSASPSILCSGFTTIVGLLSLIFMKFKIGMDLGIVLAKGVLFSLISIYTILPALIVLFYKGIRKTEKKVYLMPTDRLAGFELKFRIPLAILFVSIFGLSWYLSRRTELSYASIWESRINEVFTPKNNFSLLYRTSSEDKIPALEESVAADPKVLMTLSYPSLFKKEMTADDMCENVSSLMSVLSGIPGADIPEVSFDMDMLTPETLRFLFYAASHRERDEKMSFEDMIRLSEEVSQSGLLPEGLDVEEIMGRFMAPEVGTEREESVCETPVLQTPFLEKPDEEVKKEEKTVQEDPSIASIAEIAKPTVDESGEDPYGLRGKYHFTKEKLNTPMNSSELADYLGFSQGQASAAYSMAKKRNGTMTPDEFIDYMIDKVLGSKLLRKMISDGQAEGLYYIREEMDAVLNAPETVVVPEAETAAETLSVSESQETDIVETSVAEQEKSMPEVCKPETSNPVVKPVPVVREAAPMDRLAEMYASGRKYSSKQIYDSLHDAGIDIVDENTVELMFAYYGSRSNYDDSTRLSLDCIIDFLSGEAASEDGLAAFLDDSTRAMIGGLREMADCGTRMIRGDEWSMAAIVTEFPLESEDTFGFVEKTISDCTEELGVENFYLVGESVMYKEMKDGFRKELLFLTLLTIFSIFLIVAFSFRSIIIPAILVMTVMTGVNINVFFSGIGGHTMLYLAYLIVQSILMGATIDYGILFTNYYLGFRREGQTKADALKHAYRGSIHTIMTSGLIIILAPLIMSDLLTDPTICSILSSLTYGALSAISLIIFVLPALLAASDRLICRKR